jgi:hypothetical protein
MLCSDHAPILVVLHSNRFRTNKPFHFENWWLMEQDYHSVAKQSWQRLASRTFTQKTSFLASDLRKWRRGKPRNSDQLAAIENQLLQEQTKHPSQQNHSLQHQLTHHHHDLLAK